MPRTPKYEGDADHGAVDSSIFDLPDLPHPLAVAAQARNEAEDAEAAAMAAAAMPDQYPDEGGDIADGYARLTEAERNAEAVLAVPRGGSGVVPNHNLGYHAPSNVPHPQRHGHAAAPAPPQQMGTPMSEVMIPQKWLSRYVSSFSVCVSIEIVFLSESCTHKHEF